MTNYEKIKNMTVEEMAKFLEEITDRCSANSCKDCPLRDGIFCGTPEIGCWLNREEIKNEMYKRRILSNMQRFD